MKQSGLPESRKPSGGRKPSQSLPNNNERDMNGGVAAAIAMQFARKAWVEKERRRNTIGLICASATALAATATMIFALNKPTSTRFIYADTNGVVRPLIAESHPNMSDAEAGSWLADGLREIFDFDYVNYKDRITSARRWFSNEVSFKEYYTQLDKSGIIALVTQDCDHVRLTLTAAPFLDDSGVVDGKYTWHFVVPVQIDFISSQHNHDRSLPLKFHVSVTRIPESFSKSGLGISTFFSEKD